MAGLSSFGFHHFDEIILDVKYAYDIVGVAFAHWNPGISQLHQVLHVDLRRIFHIYHKHICPGRHHFVSQLIVESKDGAYHLCAFFIEHA